MAVDGPECSPGYSPYYMHYKGRRTYFVVSDDYVVKSELGRGAFGVVCSAEHVPSGANVAIKQIRLFPEGCRPEDQHKHCWQAQRALREIRLMRCLKHTNIVRLYDIIRPPDNPATGGPDVDMLYLVMDLMQTDLGSILRPKSPSPPQTLSDEYTQHFMYQLLDGVNELHRRGVMHRDLKPQNILVNSDGTLKICDFGLAREETTDEKTMYVETRWYRAPELILQWEHYDCAVDIWSIGCIFAEMLHSPSHAPLFRGSNQVHQMDLICGRLGVPSEEELHPILATLGEGSRVHKYLQHMRRKAGDVGNPPPGLAGITEDEAALSLLFEMLQFIPQRRINAAGCLAHRYFQDYTQEDGEDEEEEDKDTADPVVGSGDGGGAADPATPVPLTPLDLEVDDRIAGAELKYEEVRKLLAREVMHFHPAARPAACVAPAAEAGAAPAERLDAA